MSKRIYKKEKLETLIPLAQNGDIKALEEIIRKIQKHVYALFSHLTNKKEDISDLTQETLLKMAKKLPQLKNVNRFKPWLNQIITNTYNDFNRKNPSKFIDYEDFNFDDIKESFKLEPTDMYLFGEMEDILKKALLTLPKNLRICLVLREFEGLSYQEISKLTNTAIGTVKSRISRARFRLQEKLKEFI